MTPSLSISTDNIYKFSCLFGLALIISSIFAFVSIYTSSLDRKIRYSETVIPLDAKEHRSKSEDDLLALNKKLIEVTKSNEHTTEIVLAVFLGIGISLSIYGGHSWYHKIQYRDDRLAALQLEKLEVEIAKLRSEGAPLAPVVTAVPDTATNDN
jgi:hypothetical protein